MSKVSQYKILTGETVIEIEQIVNENISNGWELQGGVSVIFNQPTKTFTFCQAMVKLTVMVESQ